MSALGAKEYCQHYAGVSIHVNCTHLNKIRTVGLLVTKYICLVRKGDQFSLEDKYIVLIRKVVIYAFSINWSLSYNRGTTISIKH